MEWGTPYLKLAESSLQLHDPWCPLPQLRFLSAGELEARVARLDAEMEAEIDELRARYAKKRQPILDAMQLKRTRQQNF